MIDITRHWPWRLLGAAAMTLCILFYEPGIGGVMQRLLLPIAMGISAWLLIQNPAAATLTGGVLALIHSNLHSSDWIYSRAYPLLALVCLAIALTVYWLRFRNRIKATRAARWAPRGNYPKEKT